MYQQEYYKKAGVELILQPIDLCKHCGFVLGNAIKYMLRADFKDNRDADLRKALDYLGTAYKDIDETIEEFCRLPPRAIVAAQEFCAKNKFVNTLIGRGVREITDTGIRTLIIGKFEIKECMDLIEDELTK